MALDWLDDLAARFVTDADDMALAVTLIARRASGGEAAAAAYLELCRLVGEGAVDTPGLMSALDGIEVSEDADGLVRMGALVIACFAAVRTIYSARPDAQAARSALAARAAATIDAAGALYGPDLFSFLGRLAGEAVVQISASAANAAPLVRVETGLSLPSSRLAYDLYGDPARGAELVARNRTGTPMLMPVILEALAV